MPKAVLCSIGWGAHELLQEVARPSLEAFADRFDYDLDLRKDLIDPDRPPSWSKVRLLQERLEDYPVVLWVDSDAVVVDPRADLAALVTRRHPIALVAHTYDGQRVPNMGVVACRRSRSTRWMLEQVWLKTEYIDHKWWENAALLDLLGFDITSVPIRKVRSSRLDRRVQWLGNEWNSIDEDCAALPIIRHYPGMSQNERLERMRRDVASLCVNATPPSGSGRR